MIFWIIIAMAALGVAIFSIVYYKKQLESKNQEKHALLATLADYEELSGNLTTLRTDYQEKQAEYNKIKSLCNNVHNDLNNLHAEQLNYNKELANVMISLAESRKEDETLRAAYQQKRQDLETSHQDKIIFLNSEYNSKAVELSNYYNRLALQQRENFNLLLSSLENEKTALEKAVEDERAILQCAIETNRKRLLENSLFTLPVGDIDKAEISELMDVCRHLRNRVPLCKAIYETYYRTPLSSLINEVGAKSICGIYKLTDTTNNLVYIGQSVDIGERWKQHIKRGCGAEIGTISGSKLYNAMMEHGVWNFRFEVIQECEKGDLNKLEKYWINFFDSVNNGYNMKAGG